MARTDALFTHGRVGRHVREMVVTSGLSLLALLLTDILTLTYVSLLDDESLLATVGVGKMLLFISSTVVSGIVIAAGSLVSRQVGRGRITSLTLLVSHALMLVVAVALCVLLLEALFLPHFVAWLGADMAVDAASRAYLWLALTAAVPMAITQCCAQVLRAMGQSRRALGLILTMMSILAVMDPVLIFAFNMGVLGAGLSMLLAASVATVAGIYLVNQHLETTLRFRYRLFKRHALQIGSITLPYTLGSLAMPMALTYTMGQLAEFGVAALAAMALMDRALQIAYCFYFALPNALVPVFSQHLDPQHRQRLRQSMLSATQLVIVYGILAWGVLAVVMPWLGETLELSPLGRTLLANLSAYGPGLWLFIGLDFIAISIFITLKRAWWITFYAWLRCSVGTLPFVILGARYFGASGVMLGMWLGNAVVAVASVVTAIVLARRYTLRIPASDRR